MDDKVKRYATAFVLSVAGVVFIQDYENGSKAPPVKAYDDGVGVQTICTGHTKGVTKGMQVSPKQCEIWLKEDTSESGKVVAQSVKVPITQNQYDALVSFTFNVGNSGFKNSTLLKKLNNGECVAAANEFIKWDKATKNGKKVVLKGLTKRRQAERELFLSGC